jgi:O-antigen/teichoic acid export membrane protein
VQLATNFIARVWKSAVGWSFAVTALRAGGFLLVLPLALRQLTPAELGLWYVFASIAEFSSFAELGLAAIIGRTASFFMGGLSQVPATGLEPGALPPKDREPNFAGLAGLVALSWRIYFRLALAAVGFMSTIGLAIVASKSAALGGPVAANYATYAVLTVATALSIFSAYWPSFLNGIGQVRRAQHALLAGLALNYLVAATGLMLGAGAMSLALGQLVLALTTFLFSYLQTKRSLPQLRTAVPQAIALGELWPATWRSLLIAFAAYGCTSSTVLVCGLVSSLEVTASYGLSLRLALVAHGLAAVWLNVKTPYICAARAAGDSPAAVHYVRVAILPCALTYVVGAVTLWFLGPTLLEILHSRTELLNPSLLGALFAMIGLDFIVGFHSAVILTANRFPHLRIYLATGVATIILAFLLGKAYGVAGIIASTMIVQAVAVYWWIPRRCWQELRH